MQELSFLRLVLGTIPKSRTSLCVGFGRCGLASALPEAWLHSSRSTAARTHKHGLRLQSHTPHLLDLGLDFISQSDHFGSSSSTAIHDSQRMLARNSHRAFLISLVESGIFHQPCG